MVSKAVMSGTTIQTRIGNPEMKRCAKKGHPKAFHTTFGGWYCPICERNVDSEIKNIENT